MAFNFGINFNFKPPAPKRSIPAETVMSYDPDTGKLIRKKVDSETLPDIEPPKPKYDPNTDYKAPRRSTWDSIMKGKSGPAEPHENVKTKPHENVKTKPHDDRNAWAELSKAGFTGEELEMMDSQGGLW